MPVSWVSEQDTHEELSRAHGKASLCRSILVQSLWYRDFASGYNLENLGFCV